MPSIEYYIKKQSEKSEIPFDYFGIPNELYKKIKEYSKVRENYITFADGQQTFERIAKCENITELMPTAETSNEYSYFLEWKGDIIKGFYVGDRMEWLPILMDDQFIQDPNDACIYEICPPKGMPIIESMRTKFLDGGKTINVEEFFIFSNISIPIVSKRKLSQQEIADANETLNSWYSLKFQ